MIRKENKPVTKHTLNLYAGQVETLQSFYPRVGAAYIIRRLIDKHIEELKDKAEIAIPEPTLTATVEELL